jgi:hypothetical protein
VQDVKIDVASASPDPAEKVSSAVLARSEVQPPSIFPGDGQGTKANAYPVRWLCGHYALSPVAAKIIAGELGWLEAA